MAGKLPIIIHPGFVHPSVKPNSHICRLYTPETFALIMASTSTSHLKNADKRKAIIDDETSKQKKKKVKTVAIIESDEDERGIFNFIHTTRGINTYMTALNELSLKYGHVPLTKLDENNIQMYNPCDYSSGEEEQQDAIAPETSKKNPFIDDEAAVDHDDQDKDNVNDAEEEEEQEEGANKCPSDEDNEPDTDDGEQEEKDEDEKEAEVNEKPPDCPVCGERYKLQSHLILKHGLLKKFKFPKGKIPHCKRHAYPCKLYIYYAYKKDPEKAANDPLHRQKEMLNKRIFFICGAPQNITDEFKPKGKCDYVVCADAQGVEATKLTQLYKEIIIETKKAKKAGNRGFHWQMAQEEKKFKAEMKARKMRIKREIEAMEAKEGSAKKKVVKK